MCLLESVLLLITLWFPQDSNGIDTSKYYNFEAEVLDSFRYHPSFTFKDLGPDLEQRPNIRLVSKETPALYNNIDWTYPDSLALLFVRFYNQDTPDIVDGFRIQLYSGSDLEKTNTVYAAFMDKFSRVPIYKKYEPPVFKLRVGNYHTEERVEDAYKLIRIEFPNSFIVPDEIPAAENFIKRK